MLRILVVVIGLTWGTGSGSASEGTGVILQNCELLLRGTTGSGSDLRIPPEAQPCWYYFSAVRGLTFIADEQGRMVMRICAPPESSLLQYVRVFVHYAQTNPDKLHMPAHHLIVSSLMKAFPCS